MFKRLQSRAGIRKPLAALLAMALCAGAPPVSAQTAADAIAEKFAADGTVSEPAASTPDTDEPTAEQRRQKLIEKARRAVERALEQERQEANGKKPGEVTISGPSEPAQTPTASTPQPRLPPVSDVVKPVPVARDAILPLQDIETLRHASDPTPPKASPITSPTASQVPDVPSAVAAKEPGIVTQVVTRLATGAAGYISPLVEKKVTVLIVMDVGKTGVRRFSKTADPMLCIHEHCYISRGSQEQAQKLTRQAAFGPSVALATRGGACRSKPACVFRDIDLETVEAKLQPVDLRFLRHDRRDAMPIRADGSCSLTSGRLSCGEPVEGDSWRAWIVPESVAREAGAAVLASALERGLVSAP